MYSDKKKQLIKDINSLGERFPVVYVSNLTGYAKSNVSEYYNGEKEPSEQFLNKFYKEFHKLKKPTDSGIFISFLSSSGRSLKFESMKVRAVRTPGASFASFLSVETPLGEGGSD